MIMNDDDNDEQNDYFNTVVTKSKITAMDRKRIKDVSKIASYFEIATSLLREPKTNA